MGENCKYNGDNNYSEKLHEFIKGHEVIMVCPEVMGGLPIPRCPCEIRGNAVISSGGRDCTREYELGARLSLEAAEREGCRIAVLKARSPSCGAGRVYDGSFTHTLRDGDGVFAALLRSRGFTIFTEENFPGLARLRDMGLLNKM